MAKMDCSGATQAPPEHPVVGIDGKRYPGRYAPQEIRDHLFGRAHYLRHEDGLSIRRIVAALADEGHRRSVGWVAGVLAEPCTHCSGVQSDTPEQSTGSTR